MTRAKGITLIELLVAVAVVAILATLAYPSYQDQVRKARRADAQAGLLELSQFMERFYTVNHRYHAASPIPDPDDCANTGDLPALPFTVTPREGGTVFYQLSIACANDVLFEMEATPQNAQTADTRCGILSIDSVGVRCILDGDKCSDDANAVVREDVARCW